ncbi:Concanavalin A-like lectin/glucanases superfamily domain-containing protein [Strongyloides ratti]|uniref:Concanavalin A-like lectin/glucanases superfamily domain-containing protein n=1 Tax=Strongyloides ratti TaxID=34506 RepID=A0A090MVZ5_STRRB|nr:Concanavalin A-like lectin/glucanases superfamily domain-containing protein [Strongyloides ratti]CEF63248.1 Concanavalin A-like lectin/glucanases superfamily domain-containing protein [Strongyloides ratti]
MYNLFPIIFFILIIFPITLECCGGLSTDTIYKLSGSRILKGYNEKDPLGSIIGIGQQALEPFFTTTISYTTSTKGIQSFITTENIPSINYSEELNCSEFDDTCLWKNLDGYMTDEMDWYQGNGFLNENKLYVASGTDEKPKGNYGIVATDKVMFPTNKAVLISSIINCLTSSGTLKFKYWTSPEVRIFVCVMRTSKIYPDFDYCSPPIEKGDPGPAIISIPDVNKEPFQIFIRAENFIFKNGDLEGGFAILDDIEFEGEICDKQSKRAFDPIIYKTNELFSKVNRDSKKNTYEIDGEIIDNVCDILTCNFEKNDICINNDIYGNFNIVKGQYKNIKNDASTGKKGFEDKEGFYAVIEGPKKYSRLMTQSFTLEDEIYFMFSYHKVSPLGKLRLIRKLKEKDVEEILFESPTEGFTTNKWLKEGRTLIPGEYNYIAIEVVDLPDNSTVGIDEWFLLSIHKDLYCNE